MNLHETLFISEWNILKRRYGIECLVGGSVLQLVFIFLTSVF